MFLYKVKHAGNEEVYLHTGDFRADRSLQHCPELQSLRVNQLFLDTTYEDVVVWYVIKSFIYKKLDQIFHLC